MALFRKKYRHIFFDLDRTLWDFNKNSKDAMRDIFYAEKISEKVENFEEFYASFKTHNRRLWDEYLKGNIGKEQLRSTRFWLTLKDFKINDRTLSKVIDEAYVALSPQKTALFPHTIETLEYLSPKYPLFIVTNGFNEVQFVKMRCSNLEQYFKGVYTSENSGYQKPHAKMFDYALAQAGADKKHSIMIGDDMEADIIGAREYGIDQVFFNPLGKEHSEKVFREISSLAELRNFL